MTEENQIVIIDNGSGMVKAGFAGEDAPRCVFPAVVGTPKNSQSMAGVDNKNLYVGDEAMQKRGILNLAYPISFGIVENWDNMEKVWNHTFYNELRVTPEETQGVLLTEAPRNPDSNRERMVQIMFETFSFPNVYIALQAVMSLYSAGRTTGLVCDSGDGVTHTIPVYEGYSIKHAIEKMQIAGRELTRWMQKLLLQNSGENFTSTAEMEIVKEIKETTCYVAQDWEEELAAASKSTETTTNYTLPDKRVIKVCFMERAGCPELLFQPAINGLSCKSMPELCWASVSASDIDLRKDFLENVILSGGTTMYTGLADRLKAEITKLAPAGANVKVIASADRKYAVWKGASTLASLSTFSSLWITKEDYEESGAEIIKRKCPA